MFFSLTAKTAREFVENVRSSVDTNAEVAFQNLRELILSFERFTNARDNYEDYAETVRLLKRAYAELRQGNSEAAKAFLVLASEELGKDIPSEDAE